MIASHCFFKSALTLAWNGSTANSSSSGSGFMKFIRVRAILCPRKQQGTGSDWSGSDAKKSFCDRAFFDLGKTEGTGSDSSSSSWRAFRCFRLFFRPKRDQTSEFELVPVRVVSHLTDWLNPENTNFFWLSFDKLKISNPAFCNHNQIEWHTVVFER